VIGEHTQGERYPVPDQPGPAGAPALDGALGARLRAARQEQGRTVADCAAALKARAVQIEALEAESFDIFGGDIYVRGFIRSYGALLGLDTASLLAQYGRDPAFQGQSLAPLRGGERALRLDRSVPVWAAGLVGLIVVGVVASAVVLLGGQRTPERAVPVDAPLVQLPETAPSAPRPEPTPQPPAEPAPVGAPIELVLTLEAASWLEVVVDGAAVEPGRTVPAGETLRFEGQQTISVRYGNAGGVRAEHNGADLGPQGRPGQVIRVRYGPDGIIEEPPAT
jgi:cytoskeleton protein RodZ